VPKSGEVRVKVLAAGVKPLIARQLPLCQARQADELLGSGGVTGKIVLMPKGT
jgi:NADPH:quinone reductase-like Zn-dependent oxidoreductase